MGWAKGQSGNPGGRPKAEFQVRELARQHTAEAIHTLAAIMGNHEAPDAARVSAATAILDRGWGKPQQAVEVKGEVTLRQLILASLPQLEPPTIDQPEAMMLPKADPAVGALR